MDGGLGRLQSTGVTKESEVTEVTEHAHRMNR